MIDKEAILKHVTDIYKRASDSFDSHGFIESRAMKECTNSILKFIDHLPITPKKYISGLIERDKLISLLKKEREIISQYDVNAAAKTLLSSIISRIIYEISLENLSMGEFVEEKELDEEDFEEDFDA